MREKDAMAMTTRVAGRLRTLGLAGALLAALAMAGCDNGGDEPAERSLVDSQVPVPPAPIPAPAPVVEPPAAPAAVPEPTPPAAPAVEPVPPAIVPVAPVPAPTPPVPTPEPAPAPAPTPPEPGPAPPAPAPEPAPVPAPPPPEAGGAALGDPALIARIVAADIPAGAALAARCGACHTLAEGGGTLVGPNLYNIVGAPVGRAEGFVYSAALRALNAEGALWTHDRLDAFLLSPAAAVPGTRMGFAGMPGEQDRANVIAFLRTLSNNPAPLAAASAANVPAVRVDLGPVVFTIEQVDVGRDHYAQYCARCHGGNLIGLYNEGEWGSAPNLIGGHFAELWYGGTLYDLYHALQTTIVRGAGFAFDHGGLTDARYAELIAFLLQQNGFAPGLVPMPVDRAALARIGFRQ